MILCAVSGYLVGCINPAYILGKKRGVDIRTKGSHNAGASNAMIVLGRKTGVGVMIFDILKTTLIACLMGRIYSHLSCAKLICGSACALGHMFPFHMRFRGGKGFACMGGMMLAYDWRLFFIMLALTALVDFVTDYLFMGAVFAALAIPVSLALFYNNYQAALCVLPASAGMIIRHAENFSRFISGEELGFSWLWKKDGFIFPKDRKDEVSEEDAAESEAMG